MKLNELPRAPRTTEAKIFEGVAVVLLLIMWAIIVRLCTTQTGDIPVHFDMKGNANGYGNAGDVILVGAVGTLCVLLFMIGSYFPKWLVSVPIRIDTPHKLEIMTRMCRVLGIEMGVLFICIALIMGNYINSNYAIQTLVVVLFATIFGFCKYAQKAG